MMIAVSKLKKKLSSKEAMMTLPLQIAIILGVLGMAMLLCEAMRLMILVNVVSSNVEDATHRVIVQQYETAYSQLRESGSGAYKINASDAWAQQITPYAVISELESELDLQKDGDMYISYAGDDKEFELSDVTVTIKNPGHLETAQYGVDSGKMSAAITVKCKLFWLWGKSFASEPGFTVTIKREAGFINKF
jgi:hypothetical protein